MNNHKTLILTLRPLHKAPRVLRQIEAIRERTTITTVGTSAPEINGVRFIDYNRHFALGKARKRFLKYKRSIYKRIGKRFDTINTLTLDDTEFNTRLNNLISKIKPTVIVIHEPEWLPCASFTGKNYTVVFNAHEYFPLQRETIEWQLRFGKRYYDLYKKHLADVDLMINVSPGIQKKCLEEFNKQSILIPNAPYYNDCMKACDTKQDVIRIVHHGNAAPNREIEIMIEAVGSLHDSYISGVIPIEFKLDLYLSGNDDYMSKLISISDQYDNIRILNHVPYYKIIETVNKYDIGLFLLPENSFNHKCSLPNKLYEYLHARIGIIVTPLPEMKKFVEKYDTGIVTNGFDAKTCAETIKTLDLEKIIEFKLNAGMTAKKECADLYQQKLFEFMFGFTSF